jgi:NTP pyrophosphatase (non-canonical NTP hydrolase)
VPELADLIHAMIGCVTESAELAEHVRDVLTGAKPLDAVNLKEEFGDQLWYVALGLRFLQSNFGETFDTNIAKLRARFPDKFTEAAAMDRDIAAERAVLEQATIVPSEDPIPTELQSAEPGIWTAP